MLALEKSPARWSVPAKVVNTILLSRLVGSITCSTPDIPVPITKPVLSPQGAFMMHVNASSWTSLPGIPEKVLL
jgi:hypothetical protein